MSEARLAKVVGRVVECAAKKPAETTSELGKLTLQFDAALAQLIGSLVQHAVADRLRPVVMAELQQVGTVWHDEIMAEVDRRVAEATLTIRHVRVVRRYPFALWFGMFGGVIGSVFGFLAVLRFHAGTITDAAGQHWFATSIAGDGWYAAAFITAIALLGAGLGVFAGWVIDLLRDDITEQEITRPAVAR